MEPLELHGGQLARVNILAAKGVTSKLGARPGGFAVLNMCGEDACLSIHRTYCFVNLGTNRFNITANFASVDICGRMKELVVPWWRCSHFGVLNLTAGSPSVGGKGGGGIGACEHMV